MYILEIITVPRSPFVQRFSDMETVLDYLYVIDAIGFYCSSIELGTFSCDDGFGGPMRHFTLSEV